MRYAVIPVEGPITFHEAESRDFDALSAEAKAIVGDPLLMSREGQEAVLWHDVDGSDEGKPVNPRADRLWHLYGGNFEGHVITEGVVVTGDNGSGDMTDLDESWVAFLTDSATFADVLQDA